MSKALKKLIDINRLREFKNKLIGAGSAYVQTGAVDQTIAGIKTFLKPIPGSVTGSSGSCTGNAATATTATTAKACTGNAASATKLATARTINGTAFNGTANITTTNWGTARNISITDGTNTSTAVSVNGSANVSLNLPATIKANLTGNCSGSSGSCTGNAATATKLAAKRTIALSGAATGTATAFDGSGNITIPVTSLDASKLTGTASVSTTGNAATATTAANGVDSSGSNWIRFRNGIQICWAQISCGESGSSGWTYGASFSSTPVVTVCDQGHDTNKVYLTRAGNIGTASCVIVMLYENKGNYAPGVAQCIAIGRWK